MPINYTNRKGQTYTLYRGQTRSGKPRYYFGREGQGQGELVTEIPPGYSISESVNGVVSLAKDRPSLIQPEEVAAIEAAVQRHPEAHRYRVVVKQNRIEIYERVGPDYEAVVSELRIPGLSRPGGALRPLRAGIALQPPRSSRAPIRRRADVLPGEYRRLVGADANGGTRGGVGP